MRDEPLRPLSRVEHWTAAKCLRRSALLARSLTRIPTMH